MKYLLLLLLTGCSSFQYCEKNGNHETCIYRNSFVNDLAFNGLETNHDAKGNMNIKLPEFKSDQIKGAEAVTKAAVEAAVKSAIPAP